MTRAPHMTPPMTPPMSSGGRARRLAAWAGCNYGVSAVEFALVAPILAFLLLAGVDLGRAISERMAMDHALRAGAQTAVADPGAAAVLEVIERTAETNFTLESEQTDGGDAPVRLTATKFCACPEAVDTAVTCTTVCTGSNPTFIYYRMTGAKTYTGWIMPAFDFDRAMQVQIR